MPDLDLSDDEATTLIKELHGTVDNDRDPLSQGSRTPKGLFAELRPEPFREPLRPPKVYALPRATAARRLRGW